MSEQDIQDVIDAFARGGANAKKLGFDAVEIHGAHGYLLDQFLWEGTNVRDDAWGGSFENRLRFPVEVVKAVRDAVGPDFTISLRYSQWKQQDFTARLVDNPQDLERLVMPLSEAGVRHLPLLDAPLLGARVRG